MAARRHNRDSGAPQLKIASTATEARRRNSRCTTAPKLTGRHHDVEPEVKLATVDEERVGDVLLNDRVLGDLGLFCHRVSSEELDPPTAARIGRLKDVDCVGLLVHRRPQLAPLVRRRDNERARRDVIDLAMPPAHLSNHPPHPVLSPKAPCSGKMVDLLPRPERVGGEGGGERVECGVWKCLLLFRLPPFPNPARPLFKHNETHCMERNKSSGSVLPQYPCQSSPCTRVKPERVQALRTQLYSWHVSAILKRRFLARTLATSGDAASCLGRSELGLPFLDFPRFFRQDPMRS